MVNALAGVKIKYNNSEYKNVLNIRRELDYIYKTSEIVKKYNIKENIKKEEKYDIFVE